MTLHPPAVVLDMTIPEGMAILDAVWRERERQAKMQAEMIGALFGKATGL